MKIDISNLEILNEVISKDPSLAAFGKYQYSLNAELIYIIEQLNNRIKELERNRPLSGYGGM